MGPKKKMMSIELKRVIIEKHEQGVRVSDLARMYGRSTSMICTVLKQKESIKGITPAKGVTIISKLRTSLHENMEKLLMVWVTEKQLQGAILTQSIVCEKARAIYGDLLKQIPHTSTNVESEDSFKASRGWFDNFRKRTGMHSDVSHVPQITSNKKSEEDCVFEEKFDVADLVDIGQTFASADPLAEKTQEDDHHDFDEKSVINAQIQLQKNTASISTETNINRENVRKRVLASTSSKPKRTKKDSESKDSLDLFFDGIKSTMRQFSATDIHLLKAKIFSIVSEIEVKYLDVAETQTAADFEMVKVKEEPSDYHLEFGDEEEDERTVSILEERMIKEEMNNWHDIQTDDPLYLGDDNSGVEEEASNGNRSKVAFRPVLECCKNICHSIINPERQMQINTEFCALVTKEEKDARVCAQVDVIGDDYKKERTRVYRLPDFSGFDVIVCKRMFCVVFNLTNEMLTNALSKKTFGTGKLPLQS